MGLSIAFRPPPLDTRASLQIWFNFTIWPSVYKIAFDPAHILVIKKNKP